MYNIEITPLVKTEIRPVPEAQLLDQLYHVFLDKGVDFRVEQVNDESIVFYWTHSNDYLYTIVKEIGELLNPVEGTTNARVETTKTEQPKAEAEKQEWPINNGNKPYSLWYDGRKGKEIKETLGALYPDFLNFYWDGDKIIVQMKNFDQKIIEEIRSIAELIDNDAVRLISFQGIGKGEADEFMRAVVHEHKEKIRQSNYVGDTLTVLVDNDPVIINQLNIRMRKLTKKIFLKGEQSLEESKASKVFTYTGPDAEAINDTLSAFYSTKVETKLEGEKLTIKWKWWDIALEEEIQSLIKEIVDDRLRLLTINFIGEEDADLFMGGILRTYPEKVRQWTYNDDTLIILLNYEPGLIGKLEYRLRNQSYRRFLKDGSKDLIKGLFSDCNCPICQKHR
ncbi:hypothetical protein BZ705_15810 [Salmonella enterica subsp. enterica serovar Enteritidis]|nr:hypothetical protein [Salmonella enterica subsp. enterica serovar Weltevreden]EDF2030548.1 hypothetical protein [Salmonella enterica subsp. enterica serovar Enteritidis]